MVKQQPPGDLARESVGELVDLATDLTARFLSDRVDLSVSAAFAINRLSREGPLRLTSLATKEGVSQPSMTQLMQRLERAELVTRVPDPEDGRACLIGITDQGRAMLDDRRRLRRERLAGFLETLSAEECSALLLAANVAVPILARLVAAADAPSEANDAARH